MTFVSITKMGNKDLAQDRNHDNTHFQLVLTTNLSGKYALNGKQIYIVHVESL